MVSAVTVDFTSLVLITSQSVVRCEYFPSYLRLVSRSAQRFQLPICRHAVTASSHLKYISRSPLNITPLNFICLLHSVQHVSATSDATCALRYVWTLNSPIHSKKNQKGKPTLPCRNRHRGPDPDRDLHAFARHLLAPSTIQSKRLATVRG